MKLKTANLERELKEEKQRREDEVLELNIKLDDLWNMYKRDIGATKRDYDGLKSYTYIHSQVNDAIVKKL